MNRRRLGALVIVAAVSAGGLPAVSQESVRVSHGVSVFDDLKYRPGFRHFDYVNPAAPKGGTLKVRGIAGFDNLNPYILKGVVPDYIGLTFDSLMTPAADKPDSYYGLIAKSAELPADRSWIAFNLRPEAKFSDGTPITADDVLFTFTSLLEKGHPRYALLYGRVEKAEKLSRYKVKFAFKPGNNRQLPTIMAGLPVVSKAFFEGKPFDKTTVNPVLGSGPYTVESSEIGRNITYVRNKSYWARNLPVNRGRYNFDRVQVEYYRDRGIAFEAFMAGEYDFREEFNANRWSIRYNNDAVADGRIRRETLDDRRPSGVQAFFMNVRRSKFKDRRVRRALNLAFDFEWTNRSLFYGIYRRIESLFENSYLAASKPPSDAELALLWPFADKLPPKLFTVPYRAPATDGSGNNRKNLLEAASLLEQAGWRVRKGKLVDAKGRPFKIEFLIPQVSFKRIIGPYQRNLKRLGIETRIRVVDSANYQERIHQFDFDIIMRRYGQSLTPGVELRGIYGSKQAGVSGSRNYGGIQNPVVDALIEKTVVAEDRESLITAVRTLDRVLMWNEYIIPQWFKGAHNIAYWNKFSRPKTKPAYSIGVVDTWWVDRKKEAALEDEAEPEGEPSK